MQGDLDDLVDIARRDEFERKRQRLAADVDVGRAQHVHDVQQRLQWTAETKEAETEWANVQATKKPRVDREKKEKKKRRQKERNKKKRAEKSFDVRRRHTNEKKPQGGKEQTKRTTQQHKMQNVGPLPRRAPMRVAS